MGEAKAVGPRTLASRLDPPLGVDNARQLGLALCDAVLARGGVHGQLTPSAVRLVKGGLELDAAGDAQEPAYLPPERAKSRKLGARADVYSIGAVLYRALLGAPPFEAAAEALPPELRAIVLRCLHREPERRYADVRELRAALGGDAATVPSPPRGHAWLWLTVVLLLCAGAAGGYLFWWRPRHPPVAPRGGARAPALAPGGDAGPPDAGAALADAGPSGLRSVDAGAPRAAARPSVVIASLDVAAGALGADPASEPAALRAAALRAALAERLRARGIDVLEGAGLRPLVADDPATWELMLKLVEPKDPGEAETQILVEATVSSRGGGSHKIDRRVVPDASCEQALSALAQGIASALGRHDAETVPPRAGISLAAWGALLRAHALADQGDDVAAEHELAPLVKRADAPAAAALVAADVRRRLGLTGLADDALAVVRARGGKTGWLADRAGLLGAGVTLAQVESVADRWPSDLDLARERVRALAGADRGEDAAAESARVLRMDDGQRWPAVEAVELALDRADAAAARAALGEAIAHAPRAALLLRQAELELELGAPAAAQAALARVATAEGADAGTAARADALAIWVTYVQKHDCKRAVAELVRVDERKDVPLAHARHLAELTVLLSLACSDRYEAKASLARHRSGASRDRLLGELDAWMALDGGDASHAKAILAAEPAVTGSRRADRARHVALTTRALLATSAAADVAKRLGTPRRGDRTAFPYDPPLISFADAMVARGTPDDAALAYQEALDAAPGGSYPARLGLANARAAAGDVPGAQKLLRALVSELEMGDEGFGPLRAARHRLRDLAGAHPAPAPAPASEPVPVPEPSGQH